MGLFPNVATLSAANWLNAPAAKAKPAEVLSCVGWGVHRPPRCELRAQQGQRVGA